MITSFIVFSLILLISWGLSIIPCVSRKNTTILPQISKQLNYCFAIIIPIIVVVFLIGFRYDVGTDWKTYLKSYQFIDTSSLHHAINQEYYGYEWLYTTICFLLKIINAPSYSIFFVTTLIVLLFYYLSFTDKKSLLPYGIFTLYTSDVFFLFLNIMRQGVSFFIILFSIKYIQYKRPLKYLIFIFLAAGFHKAAWILLPFYFLAYYRKLFLSPIFATTLYMFSWLKGDLLFSFLLNSVSFILEDEYRGYANVINFLEMDEGSGLGLLMLHVCDMIIILFSSRCFNQFKSKGYDIYFNIFLIGAIIKNIAGMNMLLARLPFCLYSMRIMLGAFTLYYLIHSLRKPSLYRFRIKCLAWSGLYIACSLLFFIGNIIQFNYKFIFGKGI